MQSSPETDSKQLFPKSPHRHIRLYLRFIHIFTIYSLSTPSDPSRLIQNPRTWGAPSPAGSQHCCNYWGDFKDFPRLMGRWRWKHPTTEGLQRLPKNYGTDKFAGWGWHQKQSHDELSWWQAVPGVAWLKPLPPPPPKCETKEISVCSCSNDKWHNPM